MAAFRNQPVVNLIRGDISIGTASQAKFSICTVLVNTDIRRNTKRQPNAGSPAKVVATYQEIELKYQYIRATHSNINVGDWVSRKSTAPMSLASIPFRS